MFYAFPVQLVAVHFRNHLVLLACWVLCLFMTTGVVGRLYGVKYLFLVPEYLGEVGFPSHFFVGFAFGGFFMAWNLATYTLTTHYFSFLATLNRPFTKFCLNNALLPLVFILIYFYSIIHFQWWDEYWSAWAIFTNLSGFVLGFVFTLLIFSLYFEFTNKDISSFLKKTKKPPNLERYVMPGMRGITVETVKTDRYAWRVDNYLNERLRPRPVRSVAHYDSELIINIFRQNHLNGLVVQVASITILIVTSHMIDNPYFRIPAAASFFILMAILVSLAGAFIYWLHQWRVFFFVLMLLAINYASKFDLVKHRNKAYGLDYTVTKADYTDANLQVIASYGNVKKDKENMRRILGRWAARFQKTGRKPKLVVFAASGGGMKAAVWAMQVLRQADKQLNGKLMRHTALMVGASGGVLGEAYYRELCLRKRLGRPIEPDGAQYIEKLAGDLLNPVFFAIVSNDIFMPWSSFELGGHRYRKDRGYAFEQQLHENTDSVLMKTISDYALAEQQALVPMLFITPSITNDGRRLLISPQGVAHLVQPLVQGSWQRLTGMDAVDFGRLFEEQGAAKLQMSSALRMNAAYPYILPNTYLPSEPSIETIDAGLRDNYGLASGIRFLQVYADWIAQNTSGVVVVRVTGWDKNDFVMDNENQGLVESVANPLSILSQLSLTQAYEQENSLSFLETELGKGKLDVVDFIYKPSPRNEKASLNLHLTNREKYDILKAFFLPHNQESLKKLEKLLQ